MRVQGYAFAKGDTSNQQISRQLRLKNKFRITTKPIALIVAFCEQRDEISKAYTVPLFVPLDLLTKWR